VLAVLPVPEFDEQAEAMSVADKTTVEKAALQFMEDPLYLRGAAARQNGSLPPFVESRLCPDA
jgi:hypothetical protein